MAGKREIIGVTAVALSFLIVAAVTAHVIAYNRHLTQFEVLIEYFRYWAASIILAISGTMLARRL